MNRAPEVWIVTDRETGEEKRRYVQVRVTHQFNVHDLADAVASSYCRNRSAGEPPLPEALSWTEIRRCAVEEYESYGEHVWTWGEQTALDADECRAWATGVVQAAVPGLIAGD